MPPSPWPGRTAPSDKPPRAVEKLTRHRERSGDPSSRALYFTLPGGRRSSRSKATFIEADNVPDFEGEEAGLEMELAAGASWSWRRAVRQVESPNR